jgi:DNA-binding transcriptional ArsR family regulator
VASQLDAGAVDARVVKALGHPTRVQILAILGDRELVSPVELSCELGLALGTVGYHVRRLEQLGFIELAKRTQRRGAIEHHYRARALLDDTGAADGAHGAPGPTSGRGFEAGVVARAARRALATGGFDPLLARAEQQVVTLDARGEAALAGALSRWQATIERIGRASTERLAVAAGGQPPAAHRCTAVLMSFGVADEE